MHISAHRFACSPVQSFAIYGISVQACRFDNRHVLRNVEGPWNIVRQGNCQSTENFKDGDRIECCKARVNVPPPKKRKRKIKKKEKQCEKPPKKAVLEAPHI